VGTRSARDSTFFSRNMPLGKKWKGGWHLSERRGGSLRGEFCRRGVQHGGKERGLAGSKKRSIFILKEKKNARLWRGRGNRRRVKGGLSG